MPETDVSQLVDNLFREQYGKLVAVLTSGFGFSNLGVAEDLVQETLLAAFKHWSYGGQVPDVPEAWLMRVAKNKAINHVNRESRKSRVLGAVAEEAALLATDEELTIHFEKNIDDAMLRMIVACCDQRLAIENQIALILKTLSGLSSAEIASALLVSVEAVNKRLYRAKQLIRRHSIRLEVPTGDEVEARLGAVCTTLYLLYNEGYNSTRAGSAIRRDLCLEAMRLAKLLTKQFDDHPEIFALLALMCFHTARFDSRVDDQGALVIFEEQDRGTWDAELIARGLYYLTESARGSELSAYHLEATIAAQHCTSPSFKETNWAFIYSAYESLYAIKPNPIVLLNLAIVDSQISGAGASIDRLESLRAEGTLATYPLLYATLGQFYLELGVLPKAKENLERALELTSSSHAKAFLRRKLASLG